MFARKHFHVSRNEIYIVYRFLRLSALHFTSFLLPLPSPPYRLTFSLCHAQIKERFEAKVGFEEGPHFPPLPLWIPRDTLPRLAAHESWNFRLMTEVLLPSFNPPTCQKRTRRVATHREYVPPSFSPNFQLRLRSEFGNTDFHSRPGSDRQLPIAGIAISHE